MVDESKSDLRPGFVLFALALPILCIVWSIVRAEYFVARAERYVFTVEGYDPRDLVRGHYIQYRLRIQTLGELGACDEASEACCLCFQAEPLGLVTGGYKTRCDAPRNPVCTAQISTEYVGQALRFYVPEARAAEIEAQLRDAAGAERAQVVFLLDARGEGAPEEMRIDGVSVLRSP